MSIALLLLQTLMNAKRAQMTVIDRANSVLTPMEASPAWIKLLRPLVHRALKSDLILDVKVLIYLLYCGLKIKLKI